MTDHRFEQQQHPQGERAKTIDVAISWLDRVVDSTCPTVNIGKATTNVVDYPDYVPVNTEPPADQLNPDQINDLAKRFARPAREQEIN